MQIVSRGGFLAKPCYVEYDAYKKTWVWQQPTWTEATGFFSLATYIAQKLEVVSFLLFFFVDIIIC